jgi:hypothetical protein
MSGSVMSQLDDSDNSNDLNDGASSKLCSSDSWSDKGN